MTSEDQTPDGDPPAASDSPPSDSPPSDPPRPSESVASVSRSAVLRPSLPALVRAGLRVVRRYPGLIAVLYLLQVMLSAGAALAMMMVLQAVFGDRPLFARAVDGDVAALVVLFTSPEGGTAIAGLVWIGLSAVALYSVLSWFLTAGLIAVFLDAPARRREVVRWFGAAGASHFFSFLRLALWAALPHLTVLVAAAFGLAWGNGRLGVAVEPGEVLQVLGISLGPALILYCVVAAAVDYARIDLVRHPGMSSFRALLRGFRVVVRHQVALVHMGLYGALFLLLAGFYTWTANTGLVPGLLALVALRQAVGLFRFTAHVAVIGGQVELAWAAMPTPFGQRR